MEPQRVIVQHATCHGVVLDEHLEAAVEGEAVETICAHASANAVGRLEHPHGRTAVGGHARRTQAGDARADDHDARRGHDRAGRGEGE